MLVIYFTGCAFTYATKAIVTATTLDHLQPKTFFQVDTQLSCLAVVDIPHYASFIQLHSYLEFVSPLHSKSLSFNW